MTAREVVSSILLSSDQLLRMEKLTVRSSTHLINDCGLQVNHHTARHMLASTCLRKERVESIISPTNCFITGHLAIWLDAMLEAKQLPASIANLDTSLAKVKAKDLAHGCKKDVERRGEGD